jgi:hypothetical protein
MDTRDRTRISAVGGRRLTAWAMARPTVCFKDQLWTRGWPEIGRNT